MRIGELADQAGVDPRTIRYYESISVLPEPERTSNGYRVYRASDVCRLRFIRDAQFLGFKLREIQSIMAAHDGGERSCSCVNTIASDRIQEIDEQIAVLQRLRDHLVQVTERTERDPSVRELMSGERQICPAIDSMVVAH